MLHSKANIVVVFGLCLCCFSATVSGQTMHGTITVSPNYEGVSFTMSSNLIPGQQYGGWTITGFFDDNFNWPAVCNPCSGSQLSVGGSVYGNDFMGGTGNFAGSPTVYYASVNWGSLSPAGPSYFMITGPNIPVPVNGVGTFSGPFYFVGALCGVAITQHGCDVNLPVMSGTGAVFITLGTNQIGQRYTTSVVYVF